MVSPWSLATGPQLYRIFTQQERSPPLPESLGNAGHSIAKGLFYVTTSLAFGPVIFVFLYQRGAFSGNTLTFMAKYFGMLLVLGYGGRLIGRSMDPVYRNFVSLWEKASISGKSADNEYGNKKITCSVDSRISHAFLIAVQQCKQLKRYDFELIGVNADFVALPNPDLWYLNASISEAGPFTKALAWYAIHAFGRHMLYPGSMSFLNWLMGSGLKEARNLLVSQKKAKRAWIRSAEGDLIDTMLVAGDPLTESHRTLVITCEGNAGFYEIGIMNTPGQLGYSVLGWNTPGFGESSGLPFPKNTLAAADAVMQYAHSLGYRDEDIVLFGWSIGGFPSSWLAANYPNIKALVLDATFDDVLPLATARMPALVSGIVEYAIRTYFNLDIHSILKKYHGPLRIIRRLREEILTVDEDRGEEHKRSTNRGNYLLKRILEARHPSLIKDLEPQVDSWLAMTAEERIVATSNQDTDISKRRARLFDACDHYFVDFDANHVTPLDPSYFNVPRLRNF